jgi:hypothetical protein
MYNITLVCTRHEELGKCNPIELYKIIESLNPEIVFEEIPPSYFEQYYIQKTRNNLETDTISKYLETHKIEHIPVDSDDVPSESMFQKNARIHKRIEGRADVNGFHYRNFIDRHITHAKTYGFRYLNSINCSYHFDEIHDAIEKGLQKLGDDELFQFHELWKGIIENRDNEMLKNIYNYSKKNSYDKAIFTVGAAHRKSIMEKIEEYERKEEFKLNWTFL